MDEVFSLLLQNASVNDVDKNGWTPLHCAACNGHLDVLTVLCNSYGVDLNSQTDSGSTVLHYLMRLKEFKSEEDKTNYHRLLDLMKQKGASINIHATRGITPLHEACLRGNAIGVKWLVESGAKIASASDIGFAPLHFAVQGKSLEVIKLLIENGANPAQPSEGGTPLSMAKDIDADIHRYLSTVPIPKSGIPPSRPPRRSNLLSTTHRTSSIGDSEDMSTPEEDDEEEVIYSLDEQEDEEDVPGSINAVIPLAQVIIIKFFYSKKENILKFLFSVVVVLSLIHNLELHYLLFSQNLQ